MCVCEELFSVDHAMICKCGGFTTQHHNELRSLEADLLNMVCNDVEMEPVLQNVSREQLTRGSNTAPDARLDIHARGFWENQRSTFFDVRVCYPNAESYGDFQPQQICRMHENEMKRLYSTRALDIEHGIFTSLVFFTTSGTSKECMRYHSKLAELIVIQKGELYSQTNSWIRAKTSFSSSRSAILCLRGTRVVRSRRAACGIFDIDIDIETSEGAIC